MIIKEVAQNKIILLFVFFLLLATVFLALPSGIIAGGTLKISDIQYSGKEGKTDEDYIKITNTSPGAINLKGYRLVKRPKSSSEDTTIKSWASDVFIPAGGSYVWANSKDGFAESIHADTSTTQTITEGNSIAIRYGKENEGEIIDSINWKSDEPSLSPSEEKTYDAKIILDEISPHPAPGQEEYIELYNQEKKDVDLENYILRDGSKSGKYIFPKSTTIKNEDYLVVYKKDFKFALNDSGSESVFLYDPHEKLVDSMNYSTTKENYSLNFDGSKWRLSRFLTPGHKNVFEKLLIGKVKKDKEIYAGIYANFEAKTDSDAKKFTWNFGDGHKSYVQRTRHKYEESGRYQASLKIMGNGEDYLENFTVEVEDYEAPKVRIVSLVPNPKGKDSGEYIVIENKSKEKINLLGWSIATGVKNLYNHPVRKDFEIKKGQSKKLTKKYCAFTLNNTQSKIELRDPTGEIVQKFKYDRAKNKIEEDEVLTINNKSLKWSKPSSIKDPTENSPSLPAREDGPTYIEPGEGKIEENNTSDNPKDIEIVPQSEIQANLGKSTINPAWQNKKQNQIILLSYNSRIKTPEIILSSQPKVLGTFTEKIPRDEKHWIIMFGENLWKKINSIMNRLLLRF